MGGRGEGDRHSFTGVQQSAIESSVWKGAEAPRLRTRGRRVASGQRKANAQTDADVLSAAEALCESKTGRTEEKLVNKQKKCPFAGSRKT